MGNEWYPYKPVTSEDHADPEQVEGKAKGTNDKSLEVKKIDQNHLIDHPYQPE